MAPLKRGAQVVYKKGVQQFCEFALARKSAGIKLSWKEIQQPQTQNKKDPQLLEAFARNVNFKNN